MSKPAALWALLILQAICAAFFVFDSTLDALGLDALAEFGATQTFEYIVTVILVFGVALSASELRRLARHQAALEDQIRVASGAFEDVLQARFSEWGLTAAERDVARLGLKGVSMAEIARMRDTKEGTVKAQSASVYRKAGVNGRHQLISLFVEDLMAESLVPPG